MNEYPVIRAYLDDLAKALAKRSGMCDRIIAEAEDHLLATAERLCAGGMPECEAERTAVALFGSPSEVAARWAIGRDVFSRRKDQWRWATVTISAALLLVAAGVLLIGGRGSGERTTDVREPGHGAKALTAVKIETFYNESGGIQLVMTRTEAFRPDGARYSISRSQNSGQRWRASSLDLLSIWDPTKRVTAMVLPEQRLVSSLPMPPIRAWSASAPRTCSYLLEALDLDTKSERAVMLGYEVRKHTFGPEGSNEVWVAPDLDCYEMRSTDWRIDPVSGKRNAARVAEVQYVREGDPPGEYFEIPAGFRECPPSEIFRTATRAIDPDGGNAAGEDTRQMFPRADEQYYRIRSRRNEEPPGTTH